MSETNDSDLRFAGKILWSLATAAPAGAAIVSTGVTASTISRLPKAVTTLYRKLFATTRIGPVLKTTFAFALPCGIVALPCATLLVSAIGGMGYGFAKGCEFGSAESARRMRAFVRDFDEVARRASLEVHGDWELGIPGTAGTFDIPLVDGFRGVTAAVLIAPLEATGLAAVALYHGPHLTVEVLRDIWKKRPDTVVDAAFQTAMSVLLVAAAGMLLPLVPALTLSVGAGDSCLQGYRQGIRAALRSGLHRAREFHQHCRGTDPY